MISSNPKVDVPSILPVQLVPKAFFQRLVLKIRAETGLCDIDDGVDLLVYEVVSMNRQANRHDRSYQLSTCRSCARPL